MDCSPPGSSVHGILQLSLIVDSGGYSIVAVYWPLIVAALLVVEHRL